MGIVVGDLETAIRNAFPIIHLEIEDTSSGCGESYSVFIVSPVSPHQLSSNEVGPLKCFLGVRREDNSSAT